MDTEQVMEILREVEWVGDGRRLRCPLCNAWKSEGRYGGCKLDALLREGVKENMKKPPLSEK